MLNRKYIILLCLLSLSLAIYSQERQSYITQKSNGILIGAGFINERLPEDFDYKVFQFIYNFSAPLLNPSKIKKHNLVFQIEPQINPVFLKANKIEIEAGINFGFILNYQLSEELLLDVGFGTGLHFISIKTRLQNRGFVFSDNFILGISRRIKIEKSDWELNFQVRFRHMSNLNIKEPNYGLDNFIFYWGISKLF